MTGNRSLLGSTLGFLLAGLALLGSCGGPEGPGQGDAPEEPPATPEGPQWIQLFDGATLDGWTPKFAGSAVGENYKNTFRVEDGLLRVVYDEYDGFQGQFGHLFHDVPHTHYRLRVEYRFVGEQVPGGPGWAFRNSGVMVHGQTAESMGVAQSFPVSIEVQFLGGDGTNARTTANLCTPGTNVEMGGELKRQHCIDSSSMTYHGDQWVTVEVEVLGSEGIRHLIDGEVVLEYQRPQYDPEDSDAQGLLTAGSLLLDRGTISLQAESHPVEFRKVELLPLER